MTWARLSGKPISKRALIKKIFGKLASEREVYFRAAQAPHVEATDEQNNAENKYDTRGLEAACPARG